MPSLCACARCVNEGADLSVIPPRWGAGGLCPGGVLRVKRDLRAFGSGQQAVGEDTSVGCCGLWAPSFYLR